jgi:hypothetical protein
LTRQHRHFAQQRRIAAIVGKLLILIAEIIEMLKSCGIGREIFAYQASILTRLRQVAQAAV